MANTTNVKAKNTQYKVYITANQIKYDVTNALIALDFSEQEKQMVYILLKTYLFYSKKEKNPQHSHHHKWYCQNHIHSS